MASSVAIDTEEGCVMACCKECGEPAVWLAPRTSISYLGDAGLWAFLCDRHYSVLPLQRGRRLDATGRPLSTIDQGIKEGWIKVPSDSHSETRAA